LAQMPTQLPGGPSANNAASTAGTMLQGATPSGCQGLIDQASSLLSTFQGGAKASALSELTQAKSSLSAGNPSACMSHANKAIAMLK
ncbi:MAG TPA: hypothetical protein VN175_10615, partial [Rhizomicrobium sp.]|nr:hypothetical protein [Rhizomicrobium sp.]